MNIRTALAWRMERNVVPLLRAANPEVDVTPLTRQTCLIIQPMRCGGTLLTHLLDGHPDLNVRPYHFVAARQSKRLNGETWITDDELNRACKSVPDLWREFVYDPRFYLFRAHALPKRMEQRDRKAEPFVIDLDCHKYYAAFAAALERMEGDRWPFEVEKVVAATFAGFFVSWRNRRLPNAPALWNVSHAPRHATTGNHALACRNFLNSMPNGKIITMVRKPVNWLASYTRANRISLDEAAVFYADFLTQADQTRSDRLSLLRFEEMIEHTEDVMAKVAAHLGIGHAPQMAVPTHDGKKEIATNSSFPGQQRRGIINKGALNRSAIFSKSELAMIHDRLDPVYDKLFA